MGYNVFREIRQYEKYWATLTAIDKNYVAYVREKERRRRHWNSGLCCC